MKKAKLLLVADSPQIYDRNNTSHSNQINMLVCVCALLLWSESQFCTATEEYDAYILCEQKIGGCYYYRPFPKTH